MVLTIDNIDETIANALNSPVRILTTCDWNNRNEFMDEFSGMNADEMMQSIINSNEWKIDYAYIKESELRMSFNRNKGESVLISVKIQNYVDNRNGNNKE